MKGRSKYPIAGTAGSPETERDSVQVIGMVSGPHTVHESVQSSDGGPKTAHNSIGYLGNGSVTACGE